ncbi:MAG: hypothetical protein RLP15_04545 [Cryomorphaceae bacterium]
MDIVRISGNWNVDEKFIVNDIRPFRLELRGDADIQGNSAFNLYVTLPDQPCPLDGFRFINQRELFKFSEKVRGRDFSDWSSILSEIRGEKVEMNLHNFSRIRQENFLKSLFMIYYWLDIILMEKSLELDKMIYDEVVIEMKDYPGKLNYLYFISKEFATAPELDKHRAELMMIGNLVQLDVQSKGRNMTSFFVPVFEFGFAGGLLSNESNVLWHDIKYDLDNRVKYRING